MADKRDLLINLLGRETVSPAAKKAAGGIEDVADEMGDAARAAGKLDRQIDDLKRSLAELAVQSALTGDVDVTKQIREQERELRKLSKTRRLIDFDGAGRDGAEGFSVGFSKRIGPLLARAPISPNLIAAAAPALPLITASIAAAVTGGVALAGVGAGLALAFQDPSVKAAGKDLADDLGAELKDAAKPFVPATLQSIGIVKKEFQSLRPELQGLFSDAAQYVKPLTEGLVGGVDALVPALREVVRNAEPVVEVLGKHGTQAAAALGTSLKLLSQDAEHTADVLDGVLTATEGTLVGVSALVGGINKLGASLTPATHALLAITPLGTVLGSTFVVLGEVSDRLSGKTLNLHGKMKDLRPAIAANKQELLDEATAAAAAAAEVETLAEMIDRVTGENLSARAATRSMEEAIDAATASFKENGKTLDESTPKGRANAEALDKIATEANRVYAATLKQTGSQELATAAAAGGRAKFIELATAMTGSAAKAKTLADMLFGIPSPKPKVDLKTAQAKRDADRVQARIDAIHGKTVEIKIKPVAAAGQRSGVGGLGGLPKSHGGPIMGPGPKGIDSVPIFAAPGEHVLTAREVDAAGGHRAIERWRKSLTRTAATAAPASPGPAASSAPSFTAAQLAAAFRSAIAGLSVQLDGRTVGYIQGRQADLYARGG